MTDDQRYPIGRFRYEPPSVDAERVAAIDDIAALPGRLRATIEGLPEAALKTPYRDDGWTISQVIHHLADSHMQAYTRVRLVLTEELPIVKPYDEAAWARLPDVLTLTPDISLNLLEALHARWVTLLRALPPEAFGRAFFHPEYAREVSLDELVALYSWHGRHHLAHLENAKAKWLADAMTGPARMEARIR